MPDCLTTQEYWDRHWHDRNLPVAHTLGQSSGLAKSILEFIHTVLRIRPPKAVLEIGGAPGGYLAHFVEEYESEIHSLDYSSKGCSETCENFRLLGYPVHVHEKDIFAIGEGWHEFDVVYSLGLIEHFADTRGIVEAHLRLLRPGGVLILGVPHFVRVYWSLLSILAPRVTHGHQKDALSLENWVGFERSLGLRLIHAEYLGGCQPWLANSVIREEYAMGGGRLRPVGRCITRCLNILYRTHRRMVQLLPATVRVQFNGRWLSAYAMAAYEKRESGRPVLSCPDESSRGCSYDRCLCCTGRD